MTKVACSVTTVMALAWSDIALLGVRHLAVQALACVAGCWRHPVGLWSALILKVAEQFIHQHVTLTKHSLPPEASV